jgi:signal transduction histidine kinase
MKQAPIPPNEQNRIEALKSYDILDTLCESDFDNITAIASEICQTPISLISLIDENRQWFKSHHGLSTTETPREYAFCAHAILNPEQVFEVPDALKDERFIDNPLVVDKPHVIFYTGIPLVNADGIALGTLCVIDHKPNKLNEKQIQSLRALSNQVIQLLELRKKNKQLLALQVELEDKNETLKQFASVVSHDLKAPLLNIIGFSKELKEDYTEKLDDFGIECLNSIHESAYHLKIFIDQILAYYKGDYAGMGDKENIELSSFIAMIISVLGYSDKEIAINYPKEEQYIKTHKTALEQILMNLISNSIKYNDNEKTLVNIDFKENDLFYHFSINDNGRGIATKNQERIFELFNNLGQADRDGNMSTGIGLSTVKKLVENLGGKIYLESELSKGSTFTFSIKK